MIVTHECGIFFTDSFGQQRFQRVSELPIVDTPTLLCYKVAALVDKTPEAIRLLKIFDEEVKKRDDKDVSLTKKVKLELLWILEEQS